MKKYTYKRNYNIIPSYFIFDKSLSNAAIGLMAKLILLSNDFNITLRSLAALSNDTIYSIRSSLKELEQSGYVKKFLKQKNGNYIEYSYEVYPGPSDKLIQLGYILDEDEEITEVEQEQEVIASDKEQEECKDEFTNIIKSSISGFYYGFESSYNNYMDKIVNVMSDMILKSKDNKIRYLNKCYSVDDIIKIISEFTEKDYCRIINNIVYNKNIGNEYYYIYCSILNNKRNDVYIYHHYDDISMLKNNLLNCLNR